MSRKLQCKGISVPLINKQKEPGKKILFPTILTIKKQKTKNKNKVDKYKSDLPLRKRAQTK